MKGAVNLIFQIFVAISLLLYLADCHSSNGKAKGKDEDKDKDKDKDKDNDTDKDKDKDKSKEQGKQCSENENKPWSYKGTNGPEFWGNTYPDCSGTGQSPIQVNSNDVEVDENLGELHFYDHDIPLTNATLENNGYTVELRPGDVKCRIITINNRAYKFQQLHFHWGSDKRKGSEHIIDKVAYPMEMHLVYLSEQGYVAVVAVFFQLQEAANENLQPLVDALPDVKYKDTETHLNSEISLDKLLPENPVSRYYRYEGSLTTPDCREGVTWSLVLDPVPLGTDQIKFFRQLYSTEDANKKCKLSNNYRPVQPLNGRTVYSAQ